jgi:hypothetical protein
MVQVNFIVWPEKENKKLAHSFTLLLCCCSLSYSSRTYFNSFLPTALESGYKWHFSSKYDELYLLSIIERNIPRKGKEIYGNLEQTLVRHTV